MSSNRTYHCGNCEKKVSDFISNSYGKLPEDVYKKLRDAEKIDDIIEHLPEELLGGDTDRISGSDLDFEFFECWGDGVFIDKDGNMCVSISGSCDLCGVSFHYEIKLPPNEDTKTIDLTTKIRKKEAKP